jgi:hypothetical protein
VPHPSTFEIKIAIGNLKKNKAPDSCQIPLLSLTWVKILFSGPGSQKLSG